MGIAESLPNSLPPHNAQGHDSHRDDRRHVPFAAFRASTRPSTRLDFAFHFFEEWQTPHFARPQSNGDLVRIILSVFGVQGGAAIGRVLDTWRS